MATAPQPVPRPEPERRPPRGSHGAGIPGDRTSGVAVLVDADRPMRAEHETTMRPRRHPACRPAPAALAGSRPRPPSPSHPARRPPGARYRGAEASRLLPSRPRRPPPARAGGRPASLPGGAPPAPPRIGAVLPRTARAARRPPPHAAARAHGWWRPVQPGESPRHESRLPPQAVARNSGWALPRDLVDVAGRAGERRQPKPDCPGSVRAIDRVISFTVSVSACCWPGLFR